MNTREVPQSYFSPHNYSIVPDRSGFIAGNRFARDFMRTELIPAIMRAKEESETGFYDIDLLALMNWFNDSPVRDEFGHSLGKRSKRCQVTIERLEEEIGARILSQNNPLDMNPYMLRDAYLLLKQTRELHAFGGRDILVLKPEHYSIKVS